MPSQVRTENLPGGSGSLTKTLHPKVRMDETLGGLLSQARAGGALPLALVGARLCTMQDMRTASAQNVISRPLLMSMQRAELTTDCMARSAFPLCSGVLAADQVCLIPWLASHLAVSLLTNSPSPSECMALTVLAPRILSILVMVSMMVWGMVSLDL